jgi:hypothetical protein
VGNFGFVRGEGRDNVLGRVGVERRF